MAPKIARHYRTCILREKAPDLCARVHGDIPTSALLERRLFELEHRWKGRSWDEKRELPLDEFATFAMIEAVDREIAEEQAKIMQDDMARKINEAMQG